MRREARCSPASTFRQMGWSRSRPRVSVPAITLRIVRPVALGSMRRTLRAAALTVGLALVLTSCGLAATASPALAPEIVAAPRPDPAPAAQPVAMPAMAEAPLIPKVVLPPLAPAVGAKATLPAADLGD